MAIFFKIEVKEIYIYPLGGISKFNMDLNINPVKEFIILIMGPIFQMLAYYILLIILPSNKEIITIYNYSILGFNLLPIYPLDGGKIIKLLLDSIISYKRSLKITIYTSYIVLLIIILKSNITINLIIMSSLLIFIITKEYKKINYYYQKFILERYLNNYKFKKSKIINDGNNFYRNRKHLIKNNDKYYLEREYLEKLYKK